MPVSRTVPSLLEEMAERYPHIEFVVGEDKRWTYPEFQRDVDRLARALHALGVRRGDHVAILMGNRPEWLMADFAILSLGAVMVSINTWASERELKYLLQHSDTRVLMMVDQFLNIDYVQMLSHITASEDPPPKLEHIVRLHPDHRTLPGSLDFNDLLARADETPLETLTHARVQIDQNDIAYILYTSGSTSTPKGVQLQHYALIENMWHIGERQHLQPGDRLWLAVSLFWGLGCENALLAIMTHGATVVLQEHFDAAQAISLIERERCSVIYATPNMVRAICEHPNFERKRLATLRTGVTIGTPEQIQMLADLGPHAICNVYGLTETYGNCAVTDASMPLSLRCACVGHPLPGVEIVIVDPQTHMPLAAGEVGEIKVRGYVTCGYYKDEAKNAAAFDAHRFFLTGDLGYLDEQGRLYFRGRLKEMIKTGGINVAPIEVEEVLMSHPHVEQAYVIALPDVQRDEIVAAVVVPHVGCELSEASLIEHCQHSLAAYKRPRRYRVVSATALPLTSTGKVRKLAMPELFS